jgi:hypothetical protein
VVEAALEQVGRAGVAGDVAAQFAIGLVGAHHHRQRIPAHDGSHALLDGEVAGEDGLVLHGHGVHIRRVQVGLPADALRARQAHQFLQQVPRPLRAFGGDQRQEGVAPLGGFFGVRIGPRCGRCRREQVVVCGGGVHAATVAIAAPNGMPLWPAKAPTAAFHAANSLHCGT